MFIRELLELLLIKDFVLKLLLVGYALINFDLFTCFSFLGLLIHELDSTGVISGL